MCPCMKTQIPCGTTESSAGVPQPQGSCVVICSFHSGERKIADKIPAVPLMPQRHSTIQRAESERSAWSGKIMRHCVRRGQLAKARRCGKVQAGKRGEARGGCPRWAESGRKASSHQRRKAVRIRWQQAVQGCPKRSGDQNEQGSSLNEEEKLADSLFNIGKIHENASSDKTIIKPKNECRNGSIHNVWLFDVLTI